MTPERPDVAFWKRCAAEPGLSDELGLRNVANSAIHYIEQLEALLRARTIEKPVFAAPNYGCERHPALTERAPLCGECTLERAELAEAEEQKVKKDWLRCAEECSRLRALVARKRGRATGWSGGLTGGFIP